MKNTKSFLTGFLIVVTVAFAAVSFVSCPSEPEPVLSRPEVELKLSEESPQTTIIISWTPSEEAEDYQIERTMVRDGNVETVTFHKVAVPPSERTDDSYTYIDDTCESRTEYTYVVTVSASWSDGGFYRNHKSLKSEPCKITTDRDPKVTLDYPRNVKVEPAANKPNALTVTWDAVPNAQGYEIYYSTSWDSSYREKYKKIASTSQTSYTKEHLSNNGYYYFMVKAIRGDEYSLLSATAYGIVPPAENLTKDKAFELENGVEEHLSSDEDTLWFKCTPQKGILTINTHEKLSLTILDNAGNVVASGLPLYISGYEQKEDPNLTYGLEDNLIKRNIKNDISNFVSGAVYYFKIVCTDYCVFSICVE